MPAAFPEWRQVMDGWGGEGASHLGLMRPVWNIASLCCRRLAPQTLRLLPDTLLPFYPGTGKMLGAVGTVAEMAARGFGLEPDAFTSRMAHAPHLLAPTGVCRGHAGAVRFAGCVVYAGTGCLASQGLCALPLLPTLAASQPASCHWSNTSLPIRPAPPLPPGSDLSRHSALGTVFAGFHYDLNFMTIHGRSRYPGLFAWLADGRRIPVRTPCHGCLLLPSAVQFIWLHCHTCHQLLRDWSHHLLLPLPLATPPARRRCASQRAACCCRRASRWSG